MSDDTAVAGAGRAGGYASGRARRRQILDVALVLFAEVGYRSASLREVALRVGVSHTTVKHHFATKDALLLAALQHRDMLDAGLLTEDGPDLLEDIVALAGRNAARRGLVELFVMLSAEATAPDHPARPWFAQRYTLLVARLTRSFAERAADGRLRPGVDPHLAARRIVAAMDGLQVQWLLEPEAVDMAAALRAQIQADLVP